MKGLVAGISLTLLVSTHVAAAAEEPRTVAAAPQVEAVFVLDTTGSMSGLIQAAKDKIWSVANTLAQAKPTPKVKIGLVGYRDRGDQYVTKRSALTEDLDAMYKDLIGFQADGGGDGPESVNEALNEAITNTPWGNGSNIYRVVFLVGDAPPHMDYQNDVSYIKSLEAARERGIVVNAIQCGGDVYTKRVWREIAQLGEGTYFAVAQSGGALAADSPYDGELSKLAGELDDTRMFYGSPEEQAAQAKRMEVSKDIVKAASAPALAERASYNASAAGAANFGGESELVAKYDKGSVKIEDLKDEELPASLKPLPKAERVKQVAALSARRREIQKKIEELSKKRQDFVASQAAESVKKDSLDLRLYEAIQTQGRARGLSYEGGPRF